MELIAATGSIPRPGTDMFIITKQTLQAAIRETPEGRVYYPNGRAGYVLDAATERTVARVLTAYFFVLVGGSTICGPIMAQTRLRAVVLVVEVAAVLAFRYAALAYVLRAAPRSTVPFSREDALHRVAATYGAGRIALMVVCVLLVIPATACWRRTRDGRSIRSAPGAPAISPTRRPSAGSAPISTGCSGS